MNIEQPDEGLFPIDPDPIEIDETDLQIIGKIESIGEGSVREYAKIEGFDISRFQEFVRESGLENDDTAKAIMHEIANGDFAKHPTRDTQETKITLSTKDKVDQRIFSDILSKQIGGDKVSISDISKGIYPELRKAISVAFGAASMALIPGVFTAVLTFLYHSRQKRTIQLTNEKTKRTVEINSRMKEAELNEIIKDLLEVVN
ncbi:MAG: hypothetical protein ACTHMC_21910 [Pseudobacter sp.]|uniref:hypothetical protein n=1 Tax=Pseudobacter sp. TaxID=2045420 RepID=UPI003F7FC514